MCANTQKDSLEYNNAKIFIISPKYEIRLNLTLIQKPEENKDDISKNI